MALVIKTPIRVRFGECDYYQHVNNTVFMTYINIGLADYLREVFGDLKKLRYLFHIVHVSLDFKAPATFDDELLVTTTVTEFGKTSATFHHVITNTQGQIIVSAKKICVILDAATGKKCEVPEEMKALEQIDQEQ
jgi:YbgC/YbaW family acyl-CoA thioester hydrolase